MRKRTLRYEIIDASGNSVGHVHTQQGALAIVSTNAGWTYREVWSDDQA